MALSVQSKEQCCPEEQEACPAHPAEGKRAPRGRTWGGRANRGENPRPRAGFPGRLQLPWPALSRRRPVLLPTAAGTLAQCHSACQSADRQEELTSSPGSPDSHHQPPAAGRAEQVGGLSSEKRPGRPDAAPLSPLGPGQGSLAFPGAARADPSSTKCPNALRYLNATWADTETHPARASCHLGDSRPPWELQREVHGIWEVPWPAPHSCPLPPVPSCVNHTLQGSQRKALGTKQPGRPLLPCTSRWVVWTASPWMLYARQV